MAWWVRGLRGCKPGGWKGRASYQCGSQALSPRAPDANTLIHGSKVVHTIAYQVIGSLDALATLVTQLDVPAGGQQDGQGRLHAHRAEQRPVLLISSGDKAACAGGTAVTSPGGAACCRCCHAAHCSDRQHSRRLQLWKLGGSHCRPCRVVKWKVWLPCCTDDDTWASLL